MNSLRDVALRLVVHSLHSCASRILNRTEKESAVAVDIFKITQFVPGTTGIRPQDGLFNPSIVTK